MRRSKTHFKNTEADIKVSRANDGQLPAKRQAIHDMKESGIPFPSIINCESLIRSYCQLN